MVTRNPHLAKLQAGYLFPEIGRRKQKVMQDNPDAKIISLGIGNTTEPLGKQVIKGLKDYVDQLGTPEGYSGYGDETGLVSLRKKIADVLYKGKVSFEEVFISDGAKCDCGRLQALFGSSVSIAVQDPAYPVYVDGSVMAGATGNYNKEQDHFENIVYMKCDPKNNFFPELDSLPRTDLIYFCSPNNPTGAVATKKQLKSLIDFARKNKSIIIFDAAYAEFISDPELPKSIFEIVGARECAIEVNSFSKPIGFTGVRLGWSVVPKELCYDDGSPVINDWNRVMTTVFNGASNIVQHGGLAALDPEGILEMKNQIAYYMENAKLIKEALESVGITCHNGGNAPYIWAEFPGEKSWDVFEDILESTFVVTTPGAGFGPGGEGFVRFSAFGHRNDIEEAIQRLKKKFG